MISRESLPLYESINAALIDRDTQWHIRVPPGKAAEFWSDLVAYVKNECSCICEWIDAIDDETMTMHTRVHSVLRVSEGKCARYTMRKELR